MWEESTLIRRKVYEYLKTSKFYSVAINTYQYFIGKKMDNKIDISIV